MQVRDRAGHSTIASDTIAFHDANQPLPQTEVLVYQEINVTLEMEGRKWNSVDLVVLEDGIPIDGLTMVRMPGNSGEQSKTIPVRIYSSTITENGNTTTRKRNYSFELSYQGRHYGANPFTIFIESQSGCEVIEGRFRYNRKSVRYDIHYESYDSPVYISDSSTGNIISTSIIDINELVENALDGTTEFHFSTVPQSTCHWDFGDGTPKAVGEYVEHTYAEAGVYTVTLTFKDDEGTVTSTVEFEVFVT